MLPTAIQGPSLCSVPGTTLKLPVILYYHSLSIIVHHNVVMTKYIEIVSGGSGEMLNYCSVCVILGSLVIVAVDNYIFWSSFRLRRLERTILAYGLAQSSSALEHKHFEGLIRTNL